MVNRHPYRKELPKTFNQSCIPARQAAFNLLFSTDGLNFDTIAAGIIPPDSPGNLDYPASVTSFSTAGARYVRLEMSNCPQEDGSGTIYCAIGEVAFGAELDFVDVPEPISLGLVAIGLAGLTAARRQRK